MIPHVYHIVTLNIGYVSRLLGSPLVRLNRELKDRELPVDVLYINDDGNVHYNCTLSDDVMTEHPMAGEIYQSIVNVPHDIALCINYSEDWQPSQMADIYAAIQCIMDVHRCAMFSFDNADQGEYEINIDGKNYKCLHMDFDTESG
jgi:hypothetical protein